MASATTAMIAGIFSVFNPLFTGLAGVLAFYYRLVPNYGVAIVLLTLSVMLLLTPFMLKSTRSMLAMQRVAPELEKLKQKHKGDRQKLNEEMMALYKEHGVNPLGGCLPMLLQMPVFFIMYRVLDGLTIVTHGKSTPQYIAHNTVMYQQLVSAHGRMTSFGMDLAKSAESVLHSSTFTAVPYFVLILLVVVSQYAMTWQLTARNPQAAANPQTKMMNRMLPVVFAFISFAIPAGVVIYYMISNVFRVLQQEVMYRVDPALSQRPALAGPSPAKSLGQASSGRGNQSPAKATPGGDARAGSPGSSKRANQSGRPRTTARADGQKRSLGGRPEPDRATPAERDGNGAPADGDGGGAKRDPKTGLASGRNGQAGSGGAGDAPRGQGPKRPRKDR
ncbi:MAG: YidC/Oxa1 family membrane protein insertase [Acidimicrobiales bacterium]